MTPARRGMGLLACLLGFMASPAISADVSAWNGEESPARGRGWAQPGTTKIAASKDQAKSDATLLRIDLPGSGSRGVGWNWFGWYPSNASENAADCVHLSFWIKASRGDGALEIHLVEHAKGASNLVNLREVKALENLPTEWQQVRVPLDAAWADAFLLKKPLRQPLPSSPMKHARLDSSHRKQPVV